MRSDGSPREPREPPVGAVALLPRTRRVLTWLVWFDVAVMLLLYFGAGVLHMVQDKMSELTFLDMDVVHYNYRSSICDLLVLGPFRAIVLTLCYVNDYNKNVFGIVCTTFFTTLVVVVKCALSLPSFVFQWPAGLLVVANFLFAWGECYIVVSRRLEALDPESAPLYDHRVINAMPYASRVSPYAGRGESVGVPAWGEDGDLRSARGGAASVSEASLVPPSQHGRASLLRPASPTAYFSSVVGASEIASRDARYLSGRDRHVEGLSDTEVYRHEEGGSAGPTLPGTRIPVPGSQSGRVRWDVLAPETVESLVAIVAEDCTQTPWEPVRVDKGVRVTRRKHAPDDDSGIWVIRGDVRIGCPAWQVANFLTDASTAAKWDDSFIRRDVLLRVDKYSLVHRSFFKGIWPAASREVLLLSALRQDPDGTCISAGVSVVVPVPPMTSYVRAVAGPSGHIIRPALGNTACDVTFIIDTDVGGVVPQFVINAFTRQQPLSLARVRDVIMAEGTMDRPGVFTPGEIDAQRLSRAEDPR